MLRFLCALLINVQLAMTFAAFLMGRRYLMCFIPFDWDEIMTFVMSAPLESIQFRAFVFFFLH